MGNTSDFELVHEKMDKINEEGNCIRGVDGNSLESSCTARDHPKEMSSMLGKVKACTSVYLPHFCVCVCA